MKLAKILAAVAVLGLVSYAWAEGDAPKPKHDRIGGKITKIEGTDITIKTRAHGDQEGTEVVVKTDDKTAFTLDGKEAKLADLKADYFVRVTPREGTATKVDAFTKMPERKPHEEPKPDAPK